MSREIINNGYTIDCLLYKYQDIDWTDKKNWNLNNNKHPSRRHTYDGIDIHPFEVVFHKCFWAHKPCSYVGFEYFEK